jgi:hypothetical protein
MAIGVTEWEHKYSFTARFATLSDDDDGDDDDHHNHNHNDDDVVLTL